VAILDSGFLQIPHWRPCGPVPRVPSSVRCTRAFLRAPLPSPTCSLLPRAMAGLAPASRLACRSHIGSEEAAASVCPQIRAYGSVHGSSRKTDPQTNICSSVNRSLPFISLSLQKPFNDHWPLIHPMYTSRALLGSLRADLRPLVSNELP
jgi:hypothetical protein